MRITNADYIAEISACQEGWAGKCIPISPAVSIGLSDGSARGKVCTTLKCDGHKESDYCPSSSRLGGEVIRHSERREESRLSADETLSAAKSDKSTGCCHSERSEESRRLSYQTRL